MRHLRSMLVRLEALNHALFLSSGASWDVLATHGEVSKQALHHRLSQEAGRYLAEAADGDIEAQGGKVRHRLTDLLDQSKDLQQNLNEDLQTMPAIWDAKSRIHRWWLHEETWDLLTD